MKYEIYIKGCHEGDKASLGFIVTRGDAYIHGKVAKFENEIPTKGEPIPLLPHKGQYQMEIYAITWALSTIADSDAVIMVYTNNRAVSTWINKWGVSDEYENIFSVCRSLRFGRDITSEWMPKSSENKWNKMVNEETYNILQWSGKKVIIPL